MSDHYIGLDLFDLENNGLRQPISRITLYRGDNAALTAGDDTGLEVVADCIYVTQEMVDALLSAARGYQYHAYSAQAARLNPAAELGDTVEVGSIVSVLAQISDNGDLYPDIAAPGDREVEDEYPAAGPLTKAFDKKLAEARSEIAKTTDQITLAIYGEDGKGGLNGKMATFTVSLSTIGSKVESVEAKAAEDLSAAKKALEEDIAGLDQSFSDALKNLGNDFTVQLSKYSTIEQTDEKIATEVKNVKRYTDGKAEELDHSVSLKLEKYSTIEQTDSKIQSTVSSNAAYTNRQVDNLGNAFIKQLSKYSTIEQTDEKIATRVAKGSIISEINQSAETVQISASKINLNGYVTFSSLSSAPGAGVTKINGGWIDADTLTVKAANIEGKIAIGKLPDNLATTDDIPDVPTSLSDLKGYESDVTTIVEGVIDTDYIYALGVTASMLRGSTVLLFDDDGEEIGGIDLAFYDQQETVDLHSNEVLWLTGNTQVAMMYGDWEEWVAASESGVTSSSPVVDVSDRRMKKNITYGLGDMDGFFDDLLPADYRMVNGRSGRRHRGFVAQDVKANLDKHGISTQDFAGYVEGIKHNGEIIAGLRYNEFIPLIVDQVQRLKARVAELEEKRHGK